jgi:small subunit ribosomal protein S16
MVRLRLRRVGRKKQPSFRIVAADKESPRDGKFLEVVGFYNPRTEPETITLKEDRIYNWLSNGAQPSDATERIFRTAGLFDRFDRFKAGEDVKKLVEESEAWQASHNVSEKTRRDQPSKSGKKAKKAKASAKTVDSEAPVKEETEKDKNEPKEKAPAEEDNNEE